MLVSLGMDQAEAVRTLEGREGHDSPRLLGLVGGLEVTAFSGVERSVTLRELRVGMVLCQEVRSKDGAVVVKKGTRVGTGLVHRLFSYDELRGIEQPFRVRVGG